MKIEDGGIQRAAVDAVAGAIAGGVSRTVVSPLDVIKIRFQVQLEPTSTRLRALGARNVVSKYTGILQATKDIIREEGIPGLWRGNVPALLLVMPYTAIQFVVLQKFKSVAASYSDGDKNPKHSGVSMAYISGAVAGTVATIGSYPFDLLRTILACQGEPKVYPTMRSAFLGIRQSRGITGLYAGLTPSLVEIIPYAGLQFGSYDTLKRWTSAWNEKMGSPSDPHAENLTALQHFVCGLGAGTFAKVCCHPLDVVKKRFQIEGLQRHPRYGARIQTKEYKSMRDAISRILAAEGLAGLYKGTLPSVVKAAPAAAITFVVYDPRPGKIVAIRCVSECSDYGFSKLKRRHLFTSTFVHPEEARTHYTRSNPARYLEHGRAPFVLFSRGPVENPRITLSFRNRVVELALRVSW
ncbi:hypothetical protein R1flu_009169 [Riccia fluitans]|uniref:Mitochondrial carrier protein n=1 Tax=Riccia fluitans TaxID=41844 RepID=A0ABD1Z5G6_9MARC